jgi:hypothetical protein
MNTATDNNYTRDALLSAVHDLSEDLWAAGWRNDIEFILWSALLGDGRWRGAKSVPRAAVQHLAHLSSECDGWWAHCDTAGKEWADTGGRVFMALDKWRTMYAAKAPTEHG